MAGWHEVVRVYAARVHREASGAGPSSTRASADVSRGAGTGVTAPGSGGAASSGSEGAEGGRRFGFAGPKGGVPGIKREGQGIHSLGGSFEAGFRRGRLALPTLPRPSAHDLSDHRSGDGGQVPGVIAEEGKESGQRGEWRWGRRVFEGPGARAADRAWRANTEAASSGAAGLREVERSGRAACGPRGPVE
jgi:hypothetical protein